MYWNSKLNMYFDVEPDDSNPPEYYDVDPGELSDEFPDDDYESK